MFESRVGQSEFDLAFPVADGISSVGEGRGEGVSTVRTVGDLLFGTEHGISDVNIQRVVEVNGILSIVIGLMREGVEGIYSVDNIQGDALFHKEVAIGKNCLSILEPEIAAPSARWIIIPVVEENVGIEVGKQSTVIGDQCIALSAYATDSKDCWRSVVP
jgi:hypothetical protein